MTQDGSVFVYDGDAEQLYGFMTPDDEPMAAVTYTDPDVWRHSNPVFYVALMRALGKEPVLEIG
jgi:hypothetical protein